MAKHIWLIIFSFFISSIFWFATVSSQQNIKSFEDPISVKFFNTPTGLHVNNPPLSVFLKIDTSQDKSKKIFPENFQAFVDLTNANMGENVYAVQVKSQDQTIRIVSYSPKEVSLNLEKIQEKTLTPSLEFTGNISKNYLIKSSEMTESSVSITAGEASLDEIVKVKAVLDLKGESSNIEKKVEFKAYNSKNQVIPNVEISPANTDVKVVLSQIADTKLVGIKVPIIGTLKKATVFVKAINISPQITEIQGKKYALNTVQYIQTSPVDISDLQESTTITVKAIPPLDTEFTSPLNIKVEIIIEPLVSEKIGN